VHGERLKADKDTLSKALQAEGIPAGAHYVVPMYKQKWIAERNTFGNSHLPWSLPGARKIDYEGCCPDAEKALDDHMTLYVNEEFGKKEVSDIVKAFVKVERHCRR